MATHPDTNLARIGPKIPVCRSGVHRRAHTHTHHTQTDGTPSSAPPRHIDLENWVKAHAQKAQAPSHALYMYTGGFVNRTRFIQAYTDEFNSTNRILFNLLFTYLKAILVVL